MTQRIRRCPRRCCDPACTGHLASVGAAGAVFVCVRASRDAGMEHPPHPGLINHATDDAQALSGASACLSECITTLLLSNLACSSECLARAWVLSACVDVHHACFFGVLFDLFLPLQSVGGLFFLCMCACLCVSR